MQDQSDRVDSKSLKERRPHQHSQLNDKIDSNAKSKERNAGGSRQKGHQN